jgi:N-methylhydantoinase B
MSAPSPLLREVIGNALDTIADELAIVIMRTAFSSIVRDAIDYSTAICDSSGRTLAQGLTTPLHLGSFQDAMQNLIRYHGDRVAPEDVFIFNDPYLAAGQHLPDIYVVRPIFIEGVVEGWATTVAHHNDVGGIVPGSNSIGSTEIFQEGLRLPVLKLVQAGVENTSVWDIIAANVRLPDKVLGDIRAQLAACSRGEREFRALFHRYGGAVMRECFAALQDYSEQLARSAFRTIPSGVYRFTNYIDGLGADPRPIRLQVAITIDGETVTVDWNGTAQQVEAGINAPFPFTKAASFAALRSIAGGGDAPNAEGFTRPIKVIAPPGSIVNPTAPAACGARGITGFRMIDCMMGALAQVVPERVAADGSGGSTIPSIAGEHAANTFIFVETQMGVSGATLHHDGQEGIAHLGANQSNVPVEIIESEYPIRIERYGFQQDSEGAGRFRGGLAVIREYRILAERASLTVRSDKRRFPPFALEGGYAGSPSLNVLNPDTAEEQILPVLTMKPVALKRGDLYRHVMASGGGYGNPLDRDPQLVCKDVRLQKLSAERARSTYAVVLVGSDTLPEVDATATRDLRARHRVSAG